MNINNFSIKLFSIIALCCILTLSIFSQQDLEEERTLIVSSVSTKQSQYGVELSATITDVEGILLPGVFASFVDGRGNTRTIISDENGHFRITLDRESWVSTIRLKLDLQGFTSTVVTLDVPYPDLPPLPPCKTQEIVLKNGEGIIFSSGRKVNKDESDIYFKNEILYSKRNGKIASVGYQGNKSLCNINYPIQGYRDCYKILKEHVYIYESSIDDIHVEIRVKSYKKSKEVKISYHIRKD